MTESTLSRRALVGALSSLGLAGCLPQLQKSFTPGALDEDAKIYAFQFGATAESYASSSATSASRRLTESVPDGVRFIEALAQTKQSMHLEIHVRDYDVDMNRFDGKTLTPTRMGIEGVEMKASYALVSATGQASAQPSKAPIVSAGGFTVQNAPEGIDPKLVDAGQNAVFGVPFELNGMNTLVALARNSAFEMLVMKKRIELGQKADYRMPDRPKEKTLADVDLTLVLIAEAEAAINRWRASLILLMALYAAHTEPGIPERLRSTTDDVVKNMQLWLEKHPLVTSMEAMKARADAYGVRAKPLLLPTPQNMLLMLDENGYVAAAVKVAQGIATGSISETMSGFAGFAPKDSSARIAMEGVAAAAGGDFVACADAVGKLGGKDPELARIRRDIKSLRK